MDLNVRPRIEKQRRDQHNRDAGDEQEYFECSVHRYLKLTK